MYEVDRHDRVVLLGDVPDISAGAPLPVVVASEGSLELGYFVSVRDEAWEGASPRSVGLESAEEAAVVRFRRPYAWFSGPPNDEALAGHPLAARGLVPYSVHRVEQSSWLRVIVRMNAVHPLHDPDRFATLQHLLFTFHDSTFECLARGYDVDRRTGPLSVLAAEMATRLGH